MKGYVLLLCILFAINVFAHKERWDEKREDWTPLMCAIYWNQADLRDSLIHEGVDVNEISKRRGMTALTVAIRKQAAESVKALLETDRIILGMNRYVFTACSNQDVDIVKLLVEYGVKIDTVDQYNDTPLMTAVSFGSVEIVEFLLKSKVNIDQQRTSGMTALMLAVYGGYLDKIKLLLEYGADKNITNSNGKRAYDDIDYAISIGRISEEEGEELRVLLRPSPNESSNIEDIVQKGYVPADGFVPNEETAIKIAEAVLVPIYGERVLEKKPFIVKLEGDVWSIKGSLPEGYLGGVPYVKIQKSDCKILMVGHSK